jgi:hypothetical protein
MFRNSQGLYFYPGLVSNSHFHFQGTIWLNQIPPPNLFLQEKYLQILLINLPVEIKSITVLFLIKFRRINDRKQTINQGINSY